MKKMLVSILIVVLMVSMALPIIVVHPIGAQEDEAKTSFQQALIQATADREAQGLPVPSSISFENTFEPNFEMEALRERGVMPNDQFTFTAQTTIHFDNPEQAGFDEWPRLVVEEEVSPAPGVDGFIVPGDYTQILYDMAEEADPAIWEKYEFGHEPRTYVFEETETAIVSDNEVEQLNVLLSESEDIQQILMGFTFGKTYNQTFSTTISLGAAYISFTLSMNFEAVLGLRLPMEISLTSPDSISEGAIYTPTSSVKGLNWSVEDYQLAGVDALEGNEFYVNLEASISLTLSIGIEDLGSLDLIDLTFGFNLQQLLEDVGATLSGDFETPFGEDDLETFASLEVPIPYFSFDADLVLFGGGGGLMFGMYAKAGSERFTADWQTNGDAYGGGSVVYTSAETPVQLGSVVFDDYDPVTDNASISLTNFRYYFTQFLIETGIKLYVDIWSIFDGYYWDQYWEIYTFDLTFLFDLLDIVGEDYPYVGVHEGTTPDTITKYTYVENVAPTAVIDKSSATIVNGNPTFLAHAGDSLDLHGDATDPGLDPLVLSWDWDDGLPSPDQTTLYPLPRDATVTEMQTHAFDKACLYDISFMADDDDGGHGEDHVAVIITGNADKARMEGYWQHQYSGKGQIDFDQAALEGYLTIISHMSTVFNETRDASTIEKAHDVLFLKQNDDSATEQLDRELLVVWLNFAIGVFDNMELVDTDEDGTGDTPFADVVAAAEVVRLNPDATEVEIEEQTNILHHVSAMDK